MTIFHSPIEASTDPYQVNRAEMLKLINKYHTIKERAGTLSEKRKPRFDERRQLIPRERLLLLLDPGTPYLEFFGLANFIIDTSDRETSKILLELESV